MTKRPPASEVAAAIRAARGNLSQAAAALQCTRPTLYTWIRDSNLSRLAGVQCKDEQDTAVPGDTEMSVKREGGSLHTLQVVSAEVVMPEDVKVQRTVRVRESLWRRTGHEAIEQGKTRAEIVELALMKYLGVVKEEE